jgi:large subunit ribosomal protein L23
MENLKAKYANVLKRPRVTEKASFLSQNNVFTFEIDNASGKKEVVAAVKAFYGVSPVKVTVVTTPSKKIFFRGKAGAKSALKKAYVYLKKGDTINLS